MLVIFLHVLTMFTAVTLGYGPQLLFMMAASRSDAPALAGLGRSMARLGALIGPLFLLGGILGVTAVFVNGFDPFRTWLLIAYALFIIAMLNGIFFTGRWMTSVGRAAAASNGELSDELRTLLADPTIRLFLWGDIVLVILIIADMVLKPFNG